MSKLTEGQRNQIFFQNASVEGGVEGLQKCASAVEDYTRVWMREDGITRKILPAKPITNEELDPQIGIEGNVKLVERETMTDPAMTVPYNTLPTYKHINTDSYPVPFARMQTKKYWRDLSTLRTIRRDVREAFADNCGKDLLEEEDGKWMALCDIITGAASSYGANFESDLAGGTQKQHYSFNCSTLGFADDIAFNDALKIMPAQDNHIPVDCILINSLMINDLQKWDRNTLGDLAAEITINGWAEKTLLGKRLIVTIKHNLVKSNTAYFFAEPKWLGRFYVLQDATMHMDRVDSNYISFFMFAELGAAIGNTKAVAKATFAV